MNKQMFLDGLRAALAQLPADEIEKTLSYYAEIIDDRIEDGMSEEEAVASMEPIETLAARVVNEAPAVDKAVRKVKNSGIPTGVWVVLAIFGFPIWFPLLLAGLALIFATFVSLIGVIISLVAVVAALAVSGLVVSIVGIATGGFGGAGVLLCLGVGFILLGLALLLAFPVAYLIKGVWFGIKALFRKIRSWFKR